MTDGIRIDDSKGWFNIRCSNTEPVIRLVVEDETKDGLKLRLNMVEKVIIEAGGVQVS